MIRILRPCAEPALLSARVFEHGFSASLRGPAEIRRVPAASWLAPIVAEASRRGGESRARRAFVEATRGSQFLCPDHRTAYLAPLLLHLRNASGSDIRLLLVAHAPGACPLDWALLWPLLRPGDRILAPTASAGEVIGLLCPALRQHTRVVPHGVFPLPRTRQGNGRVVAVLTRIHPSKLLHRQIEALALLRRASVEVVRLHIAGMRAQDAAVPYARSLVAKARRLGLSDRVELLGQIEDPRSKSAFLADARILVNLSVSVEESFGKAPVEALGCGIPALVTRWNGLPETIGAAGRCVAVHDGDLGMDVDPAALADAIAGTLQEPPSVDLCRAQAERFTPDRARRQYVEVLAEALDAPIGTAREANELPAELPASPPGGVLANTAPLTHYSWEQIFDMHAGDAQHQLRRLAGRGEGSPSDLDQLRALLMVGVRRPVGRLMAGLPQGAPGQATGRLGATRASGDLSTQIASSSVRRATRSSRTACLMFLAECGRGRELRAALARLRPGDLQAPARRYLDIEALRLDGRAEDAARLALEPGDPVLRGEQGAWSMRQLAAIARDLERPALALPRLREWLERYPDSPNSGLVWLDLGLAALRHRPPLLVEARAALDYARKLHGDTREVQRLAELLPAQ